MCFDNKGTEVTKSFGQTIYHSSLSQDSMIRFGYLLHFYVWGNLKTPPATLLICSYLKWQEGKSCENGRLMEIRLNTASDFVLYEQIGTNKQKTCSTHPITAKERHSSLSPVKEGSKSGTSLDGLRSPCSTETSYGSYPFLCFRYPKLKSDKLTSSDPVCWKLLFHNDYY